MINKVGVDAFTMWSSTSLTSTNAGAHFARLEGELALHAHGDVLLELGQDVHRWVDDLVR